MHKSAMQMQHARDMQRGVSSVGGNLSVMGAEVKPHQCQQCLKSFSSNHQLVQHIRVHTGENEQRKYSSDDCIKFVNLTLISEQMV